MLVLGQGSQAPASCVLAGVYALRWAIQVQVELLAVDCQLVGIGFCPSATPFALTPRH